MIKRFFSISENVRFHIEGYGILVLMVLVGIGMVAYPVWAAVYYDLPTWASAQDKSNHTVAVFLYARPEREGSRTYVSATVDGKAGYLRLNTRGGFGLTEVSRHDILQAPKMVTKDEPSGVIRNWPTHSNLIISSRTQNDWTEDRRSDSGIKVPTAFHRIDFILEPKLGGSFDSVTIIGTDYDNPDKLIKKDCIVISLQDARALYEFSEAGTPVEIGIALPTGQ